MTRAGLHLHKNRKGEVYMCQNRTPDPVQGCLIDDEYPEEAIAQ